MSHPRKTETYREYLQREAHCLLIETGAIMECALHGGEYILQDDRIAERDALKLALRMQRYGEMNGSREDIEGAIDAAKNNVSSQCPLCRERMS